MTPPTGMSGTTGTIRHPDVSEISDLTEGLLSPSRTAEIRRHLGDCALCADVRTSLEEIRSLLGTLPGPARMPGDIAGRIDAALAAEALLDATQPQAQVVPADRPRTPDRDVSRGTPPATAGRYPRPAGHPTGPTGPGRRRARRRIAVLAGLAGAAACALGIFLFGDFSGTPPMESPPVARHPIPRRGRPPPRARAATPLRDSKTASGSSSRAARAPRTFPRSRTTPSGWRTPPPPPETSGQRLPSPSASSKPPVALTPRSPPNVAATRAPPSTSSSCRTRPTPPASTPTSSTRRASGPVRQTPERSF